MKEKLAIFGNDYLISFEAYLSSLSAENTQLNQSLHSVQLIQFPFHILHPLCGNCLKTLREEEHAFSKDLKQ